MVLLSFGKLPSVASKGDYSNQQIEYLQGGKRSKIFDGSQACRTRETVRC